MNYLIIKTHTAYSVAVDTDGRFMNVLNQSHREGQYVNDVIPIENIGKEKKKSYKGITAALGAAACVMIAFLATTLYMPDPYGTVYFTINPQIEMKVSEKGKVVSLNALNEDGESVIKGIKWKKKDAVDVAGSIIQNGIKLGLIKDDSNIRLDIDTDDDIWFSDMGLKFRTGIDGYIEGKVSATVEIYRYGSDNTKLPAGGNTNTDSAQTNSSGTKKENDTAVDDTDSQTKTPKKSSPEKKTAPVQTDNPGAATGDDSGYSDSSSYDDSNYDGTGDDDSDYD